MKQNQPGAAAGGGGPGGGQGGAGGGPSAFGGSFEEFGAVPVTPRNFYSLMQRGECALLFPGGVREANHGKVSFL